MSTAPSGAARGYAQTYVGLVAQIERLGWTTDDLARVGRAYRAAMTVFTGHFRPTGDTFLSHLVRTASILADTGSPPSVVTAGLLHSAYSHGEFGDGRRGTSGPKRTEIRGAAGDDAEALVHRYCEWAWRPVLDGLPASVAALGPVDRAVLAMRLANELEERLEAPADLVRGDEQGLGPHLEHCAEAARLLANPALADALLDARRALPAGSRSRGPSAAREFPTSGGAVHYGGRHGLFLLPPRSHRPRPVVALRSMLRRSSLGRALIRALRGLTRG